MITAVELVMPLREEEAARFSPSAEELIIEFRETAKKLGKTMLRKWRVRLCDDDFQSTVDLALCEAARGFCPEKGASFPTFLFHYVRGALLRTIEATVNVQRLKQAASMAAAPTIPADFECDSKSETLMRELSANAPADSVSPEEEFLKCENIKRIREVLVKLEEIDRKILVSLFQEGQTLSEVAKSLQLGRREVARIRNRAMLNMKLLILADDQSLSPRTPAVCSNKLMRDDHGASQRPRRRRSRVYRKRLTWCHLRSRVAA